MNSLAHLSVHTRRESGFSSSGGEYGDREFVHKKMSKVVDVWVRDSNSISYSFPLQTLKDYEEA